MVSVLCVAEFTPSEQSLNIRRTRTLFNLQTDDRLDVSSLSLPVAHLQYNYKIRFYSHNGSATRQNGAATSHNGAATSHTCSATNHSGAATSHTCSATSHNGSVTSHFGYFDSSSLAKSQTGFWLFLKKNASRITPVCCPRARKPCCLLSGDGSSSLAMAGQFSRCTKRRLSGALCCRFWNYGSRWSTDQWTPWGRRSTNTSSIFPVSKLVRHY